MNLSREQIRELVGGYATGSLSEAERNMLFSAALEDQELFDELMREQELHAVLEVPGARGRLIEAVRAKPRRSSIWAWATGAGLAAAALATILFVWISGGDGGRPAEFAEMSPQGSETPSMTPREQSQPQQGQTRQGEPESAAPQPKAPEAQARSLRSGPSLPTGGGGGAAPAPAPPVADLSRSPLSKQGGQQGGRGGQEREQGKKAEAVAIAGAVPLAKQDTETRAGAAEASKARQLPAPTAGAVQGKGGAVLAPAIAANAVVAAAAEEFGLTYVREGRLLRLTPLVPGLLLVMVETPNGPATLFPRNPVVPETPIPLEIGATVTQVVVAFADSAAFPPADPIQITEAAGTITGPRDRELRFVIPMDR